MGFLDSLLGKTELPEAKIEKLFAISTAAVTLEANLNLKPDSSAAICFKPLESSSYETARTEIEDLLKISANENGTEFNIRKDEFGYLWVVLSDKNFEDLVASIHMIAQIMIEKGFGTQLLCAVYRFQGESIVYWVYSFKQGSFYPFVPLKDKDKQRDNAFEFRLKAIMEKELPLEKDVEKWYPIWGMPI